MSNNPVHRSILVVGLGNPILGDDGIGWRVVEKIQPMIPHSNIEFELLSLGGLSLMERLIGYERVIIVDAITTHEKPIGTVSVFPLSSLPNRMANHLTSAHDTTLQSAIEVGRGLGADLPTEIVIVGVETDLVYDFTEQLSPPVEASIPQAIDQIQHLLSKWVEGKTISN